MAPTTRWTLPLLAAALLLPLSAAAGPPTKPGFPKPGKSGKSLKPSKPGKGIVAGKLPGRLGGDRPELDADSILGLELRHDAPTRKGSIGTFRSRKVEISPGKQARLGTIADAAFAEHDEVEKDLQALKKKGAIVGAVESSTEIYEFDEAYVLVRSTGATVADARAVKKAAPEFLRISDGKKHAARLNKLNAESKSGLAAFKAEAKKRPSSDPLRKAADKGDQALLNAIASGKGHVEMIDTLHVPKRAPRVTGSGLQIPRVVGGRVDYDKQRTLPGSKALLTPQTLKIKNKDAAKGLIEHRAASASDSISGRTANKTTEFVAGNTWAESWVWERQWNVPSGFLRVRLGASYAIGLRIPIEIKTTAGEMFHCEDGLDRERTSPKLALDVRAKALDADAEFYRRAGLDEDAVVEGKELALHARVGYGYKLRLFWTTLANQPYTEHGVDWGRNFDPPQGAGTTTVYEDFLDAETTHTGISAGRLTGGLQLGFRIDVSGKVQTEVSALQDGKHLVASSRPSSSRGLGSNPKASPQELTASNALSKRYSWSLRKGVRQLDKTTKSYDQHFGFRIDDVRYDSSWSVVPGIRVGARASYAGYSVNVNWDVWLDELRIPVGSLELGHHPGTRASYEDMTGRKIWHREAGASEANWCRDTFPPL